MSKKPRKSKRKCKNPTEIQPNPNQTKPESTRNHNQTERQANQAKSQQNPRKILLRSYSKFRKSQEILAGTLGGGRWAPTGGDWAGCPGSGSWVPVAAELAQASGDRSPRISEFLGSRISDFLFPIFYDLRISIGFEALTKLLL